jgi:hypothetical protein
MGFNNRMEAHHLAMLHAKADFIKLNQGFRVKPHDVRLGGRGKITDRGKPGNPAFIPIVGRLILMLSHRDLLILGSTEQMLTRMYLGVQYPVSVGFGWSYGNAIKLVQTFAPYSNYFCFDASKFDSSISSWLVWDAISILRDRFQDGHDSKYDAYWQFVYDSLVAVIIRRDDGIRMQKMKGTTSGHCHNTLVQSIITLIVGYGCLIALCPHLSLEQIMEDSKLWSLGDDNLMGLKGELAHLTKEQIQAKAMELYGINWSGRKSFTTQCLIDGVMGDFEGVQYLGKFLFKDVMEFNGQTITVPTPYRPFLETVEKVYYPERPTDSLNETYEKILGNYYDAAGNPETAEWLDKLLDWMEAKGAYPPDEWSSAQAKQITKDYYHIGSFTPRPLRITREDWLIWTHVEHANGFY